MDKRMLWFAVMFCSALLMLTMFVSFGAAEQRISQLVNHAEELEQQVYDRDEIIAAQQRLISAYQEQNAALASLLGQASDALQQIAYGPYTREEIQSTIAEVAEVIQEVNKALNPARVQEISQAIVTNAVAAEVDPMLLLSMAITESNCRPTARGSSGEYGMLQVMPGTGRWIAEKLGYKDWEPADMMDIRMNVEFSAYYLRVVTREFGGDTVKGVLAYNRGSTGARQWLAEHQASDHRYVKKVMGIYQNLGG